MSISISGSGAITGVSTNYSFDKSVSIAGTATYEDVTSVDSVGIITAQSGLHVTGGNVKIGTDGPSAKLHISNGNANDQSDGILLSKQGGNIYGIYPSTNNLEFKSVTGNTHIATFDYNGKIGIGTTSPDNGLHILDSASIQLKLESTSTNSRITFEASGTTATPTIGAQDNDLQFRTGNNERMRIDSSGRVGIGTDNPSTKLHISAGDNDFITLKHPGRTGTWEIQLSGVDSQNLAFYQDNGTSQALSYLAGRDEHRFHTADTERMRIDSSGRLLIGATSSSENPRLVVRGNVTGDNQQGDILLLNGVDPVENNYGLGAIKFGGQDDEAIAASIGGIADADWNTGGDSSDCPGRLVFSTVADGSDTLTEWMRIGNNGQKDNYSTSGSAFISRSVCSAGTGCMVYEGYHSATSTTTGTLSYRVYSNGNVENTNLAYGQLSDVKLKENIVDASSQWDDIKRIQVRNYNFKEETGHETHTQIGVVAQELETVSPGLVYESPDLDAEGNDLGTVTKGVIYSVLYMKAVKALQEAMDRIETLETQNASLEARLTTLEGN